MKEELLALLAKHEITLPDDIDNYTILDLIFKQLEKENPPEDATVEEPQVGLL